MLATIMRLAKHSFEPRNTNRTTLVNSTIQPTRHAGVKAFQWYNFSHHHSGLAGFTPAQVFTGEYLDVAIEKQQALDNRFAQNPERFVKGRPGVAMPPERVEISPLTAQDIAEGVSTEVNFPTLTRVLDKYNLTKN